MSDFSRNLKYLREKYHLSQNRLATLAKVNQTTITRWENEEISPSLDNVIDIANVLNVSVADLTGRDLSKDESAIFDELELLFLKHKDILTEEDREYMRFIIEKRIKDIDKQNNRE